MLRQEGMTAGIRAASPRPLPAADATCIVSHTHIPTQATIDTNCRFGLCGEQARAKNIPVILIP